MANITTLPGGATLSDVIAKVNEMIDRTNDASIGNEALGIKVNSTTMGNTALKTKMDEVYSKFEFPSEEPVATPAPEIPEDEFTVTISAVARTFKFNVPSFKYEGAEYKTSDLVVTLLDDESEGYNAAKTLVTALVAQGSSVEEGEEGGILTETTV